MRQRSCAGVRVMSRPAKSTRPSLGRTPPVMILNMVLLPAPLGPMTPSASPSASSMLNWSVALTEPKLLETPSSAISAAMPARACGAAPGAPSAGLGL